MYVCVGGGGLAQSVLLVEGGLADREVEVLCRCSGGAAAAVAAAAWLLRQSVVPRGQDRERLMESLGSPPAPGCVSSQRRTLVGGGFITLRGDWRPVILPEW